MSIYLVGVSIGGILITLFRNMYPKYLKKHDYKQKKKSLKYRIKYEIFYILLLFLFGPLVTYLTIPCYIILFLLSLVGKKVESDFSIKKFTKDSIDELYGRLKDNDLINGNLERIEIVIENEENLQSIINDIAFEDAVRLINHYIDIEDPNFRMRFAEMDSDQKIAFLRACQDYQKEFRDTEGSFEESEIIYENINDNKDKEKKLGRKRY